MDTPLLRYPGEPLTRYPIKQVSRCRFLLLDLQGRELSWHRTKTGALRARRVRIEDDELEASYAATT